MQRRLGGRVALVTELEFAGRRMVVYNAHLESRSAGPIQAAQLDEMLADLKRYPAGTPAILGGDLNTKYFPSIYLHKLERARLSQRDRRKNRENAHHRDGSRLAVCQGPD